MTVLQSLAGAMGCASWRVRSRLIEYQSVAPVGGLIVVDNGGLARRPPRGIDLNEVGVTDGLMAMLWRVGPAGASYAVTSRAESDHLGADIAIVDRSNRRILLYQAKLASLEHGDTLVLKSPVTDQQLNHLRGVAVEIEGEPYTVTGRLALYQTGYTPFLFPHPHLAFDWWDDRPWSRWGWTDRVDLRPDIARRYYEEVLCDFGCSPGGVLAVSLASFRSTTEIRTTATWPWEFDTYSWWTDESPLKRYDGRASIGLGPPLDPNRLSAPPRFDRYFPADGQTSGGELAATVTAALSTQLELAPDHQLFVIVV